MFLQILNEKADRTCPTLFKDKEDCCGCAACVSICPTRSIKMETDEEGFNYPLINSDTCVRCYQCLKVCPIKIN